MISTGSLRPAVERLEAGGFVAYPTETVWGLGACVDRPRAVERLVDWKRRRSGAPMSILVRSLGAALGLGCTLGESARRLAEAFWPGPLTLVVECDGRYSSAAEGDHGAAATLGLRCSSHPVAHALAVAVDRAGLGPLTSTSLNRSGESPARNLAAVMNLIDSDAAGTRIAPFLVRVGSQDAGGERPSSVVDCTGIVPRVLRAGALDAGRLEKVWSQESGSDKRERTR